MKKLAFLSLLLSIALLLGGCSLFYTTREVDLAGTLVLQGEERPVEEDESPAPMAQLGNPWKDYETLAEALETAGYPRDLPESIGEYRAEVFRVLNGELLEVVYRLENAEITLRWSAEENADISGVHKSFLSSVLAELTNGSYNVYRGENGEELWRIFLDDLGSYSLHAPTGFDGESVDEFSKVLLGE